MNVLGIEQFVGVAIGVIVVIVIVVVVGLAIVLIKSRKSAWRGTDEVQKKDYKDDL